METKESAKKKKKAVKTKAQTKTNDENGGVLTQESGSVRKNRSFKRIRGFLSGESRRERRARKASASASASASRGAARSRLNSDGSSMQGYDDETIYNVDVEERSVSNQSRGTMDNNSAPLKQKAQTQTQAQANMLGPINREEESAMEGHEAFFKSDQFKKPYLLKVVLLLMDPNTRRFELLQLEFDSLKALVSDVLAQIPVSVTEDALRKQAYSGVCGHVGQEMTSDKLLATFCHGNDVLVAIPTGLTAKECARLAKPILGDVKVGAMLLSSGIDARAWREELKAKKTKKAATTDSEKKPKSRMTAPPSIEKSPSNKVFVFASVALLAILLQVFHLYISAPIRPGHVVSPGIWLSKCGILGFWPGCDNRYLKMDDLGTVTLYNSNQEVAWEIKGGVCADGDDDCIPGMHVNFDGTVAIGGMPVSWVSMYGYETEQALSPWPFAESPKVKIWKKSNQ